MTTQIPPLSELEYALRREEWLAEGRLNAFQFAIACQGDLDCILDEIRAREEVVAKLAADYPKGPMAPGASPRIYRDAYLAGLREACDLIRRVGRQSE